MEGRPRPPARSRRRSCRPQLRDRCRQACRPTTLGCRPRTVRARQARSGPRCDRRDRRRARRSALVRCCNGAGPCARPAHRSTRRDRTRYPQPTRCAGATLPPQANRSRARIMTLADVDHRRSIIDRRAMADRLAALRGGHKLSAEAAAILRGALEYGRAEIAKRLAEEPGNGRAAGQATAFLHDQLVRLAYDFIRARMVDEPATELALVGLGGTGRGEMAPFSDLDLMFLTSKVPAAAQERAAEATLHLLWALK